VKTAYEMTHIVVGGLTPSPVSRLPKSCTFVQITALLIKLLLY